MTTKKVEPEKTIPMNDHQRIDLLAARLFERDFQETGVPRPFDEISDMAKARYKRHALDLLNFMFGKLEVSRKHQLDRANEIIGWMMPYIGNMCPPPDGLFDLNQHCCENTVPMDAGKGKPVKQ